MSITNPAPRLVSFASIAEENTLEQAARVAAMPFVTPHLALMPDAHLGKGATVGSVIPTERAIIPAAVGVDIGCGMIAVRTQFTAAFVERMGGATFLRSIREEIESRVPLSAGNYNASVERHSARERIEELYRLASDPSPHNGNRTFYPTDYALNWDLQLGTLGSGNHFIEVSLDEQDRVWFFLHSGSRGVGNKIAQHHISIAKKITERYYIPLADPDLAYLVEGTPEFAEYLTQLRWAQRFALLNREEMMDRVVEAWETLTATTVDREQQVNCHHNYTSRERHYGKDVWLSRKGAIDAHAGVWGLIPGSMGDKSYVVLGKGNRTALCSAPHGAGRQHSRTSARKTFTVEQLREAMTGIEYRDTDAFIDEIPAAYKPIDVVMNDAADLVEIRHTLRQIINVKGD